jgi:hypothetical protein
MLFKNIFFFRTVSLFADGTKAMVDKIGGTCTNQGSNN